MSDEMFETLEELLKSIEDNTNKQTQLLETL